MITQKELKDNLNYDSETGIFTWKLKSSTKTIIDSVAGSLNKVEGYIQIKVLNKRYQAHRLAWLYMTGSMPKEFIDHINGIRNDNRFTNIREASNKENLMNCGISKNNKSGFKGVSYCTQTKKWKAEITLNGVKHTIGRFFDKLVAAENYKNFAKLNHGEFYHE